jgi:stage II sporulation protein E
MGKKVCGDSQSLIKLEDGKYMVSICDGMGSGEKAHRVSRLTLSLIENFYRAGFENDIILSSVNKLLSLSNEETFSAVDVCVLDLNSAICDFIKLGATYGFVKRNSETVVIESSGLPIGVLDEMRPHITKSLVQANDIIILISDGISDAFEGKEELVSYINNIENINPQTIADDILNQAYKLNGNIAKDDMSVLVVRVYIKD